MRKLIDLYGFGVTQEVVEALEQGTTSGQMQENQIQAMKAAMAEVLQDTGAVASPEQRVQEGKVATAEAVSDIIGGGG